MGIPLESLVRKVLESKTKELLPKIVEIIDALAENNPSSSSFIPDTHSSLPGSQYISGTAGLSSASSDRGSLPLPIDIPGLSVSKKRAAEVTLQKPKHKAAGDGKKAPPPPLVGDGKKAPPITVKATPTGDRASKGDMAKSKDRLKSEPPVTDDRDRHIKPPVKDKVFNSTGDKTGVTHPNSSLEDTGHGEKDDSADNTAELAGLKGSGGPVEGYFDNSDISTSQARVIRRTTDPVESVAKEPHDGNERVHKEDGRKEDGHREKRDQVNHHRDKREQRDHRDPLDQKERSEFKEQVKGHKEHSEPKEKKKKEQKERIDHAETKEQKDKKGQELKEQKEKKELKEKKERTSHSEMKEQKERIDHTETKEPKDKKGQELKEQKVKKELKEKKDQKEQASHNEMKEQKEPKKKEHELKERKEKKGLKEHQEHTEPKEPKERKDLKEVKHTNMPKDLKQRKEATELDKLHKDHRGEEEEEVEEKEGNIEHKKRDKQKVQSEHSECKTQKLPKVRSEHAEGKEQEEATPCLQEHNEPRGSTTDAKNETTVEEGSKPGVAPAEEDLAPRRRSSRLLSISEASEGKASVEGESGNTRENSVVEKKKGVRKRAGKRCLPSSSPDSEVVEAQDGNDGDVSDSRGGGVWDEGDGEEEAKGFHNKDAKKQTRKRTGDQGIEDQARKQKLLRQVLGAQEKAKPSPVVVTRYNRQVKRNRKYSPSSDQSPVVTDSEVQVDEVEESQPKRSRNSAKR